MGKVIDVMSLYPKDMNIYGDSGNVLVVLRRLALYGYEPRLHAYNQGDEWPERVDMILGGGGQDTGQKKITGDLFKRAGRLRDLAADGTPMLMICGLFQLFGEYFETSEGERLDAHQRARRVHGGAEPPDDRQSGRAQRRIRRRDRL